MPPKKPPSKGKSPAKGKPGAKGKGKGKGKGKDKDKPPKESKADKKLKKKYGTITYEGNYIASMRRDEMEYTAEKLREEVTLQRSERIRFQLERDYLYDLYQLYLARVKEIELKIEAQVALNNRLVQDTEELGIVKGQEAKHFRYEIMLKRARMDMSDELRRKRLTSHADRIWQNACIDIDSQLDLQDKREAEFLKKMQDTKEELNDVDKHLSDMKEQMKRFAKEAVAKVQQSLKDCAMITKMDSVEQEEVMNEMLFASCTLNDNLFENIQNYYNDMTSNNLNVIIMMRDRYEELFDHNKFLKAEIERYEDGAFRATKIMKKLKPQYNRTKIKHDQAERLEQGLTLSMKGIEMCDAKLAQLQEVYSQLIKDLTGITEERNYFRENTGELASGVMDAYRKRYRLDELKNDMERAIQAKDREEDRLIEYFPDPMEFYNELELHRSELNKKNQVLDRYLRKLTLEQWEIAERHLEVE